MMRRPFATPDRRPRSTRAVATALALVALLLRLWGPAPGPLPQGPERTLAALFGEHALCLSATSRADHPAAPPLDQPPSAPGGHTGHDAAGCCQWHASGGLIVPGTGAVANISFPERVDRLVVAALSPPGRSANPAQARAPPFGET